MSFSKQLIVNIVSNALIKYHRLGISDSTTYYLGNLEMLVIQPLSEHQFVTCKYGYYVRHPYKTIFYLEVTLFGYLGVNGFISKPFLYFFIWVSTKTPLWACLMVHHIVSSSKYLICTRKEYVFCHLGVQGFSFVS